MSLLYPTKTLTVASGDTSGTAEIEDFEVLAIDVPTIDSGTLKIQGCVDGTNYRDIYDGNGTQVLNWTVATTGDRIIATRDLLDIVGCARIAVVLGAAQTADRTFTIRRKVTL